MSFKLNVFLHTLAAELDRAERFGSDEDSPEGSRYIQLSDTLARSLAAMARDLIVEPAPRLAVMPRPVDSSVATYTPPKQAA